MQVCKPVASGRNEFRLIAIVAALCMAYPALAADKAAELEEVRVTATRSTVDVDDTPRAISVIDKKQIEEKPSTGGIQSMLEEVPGITYARSGGLGGQIIMRGFNSNSGRSTLAIDGDRYRGRTTLEYNMIDPNAIERIEVIRGPSSVLWGADAMNGVVNVVTRRAYVAPDQPFTLNAHVRALEYSSVNNMIGGRTELYGGGNGFDVLVGVNYRDGDDYKTPKGTAENSGFNAKGVDARIGYSPNTESRWELAGRFQETTTERAGGLGAAPGAPYLKVTEDPIIEQFVKLSNESKNVGALADLLESSIYVRKFRTDIYQSNATTTSGTLNPVTTNQLIHVNTPTVIGGRVNATKTWGAHTVAYGVDAFQEDFAGRTVDTTRTNTSTGAVISSTSGTKMERASTHSDIGVFVSDEWKVNPALTLSGAVRVDHIRTEVDSDPIPGEAASLTAAYANNTKTTDTPVTGSIGSVFKLTPKWSTVAQISKGFRAPSGIEKTTSSVAGTITTLPSPDLKPEENMTYEAGFRYRAEDFQFNTTAFFSKYKNLIVLTNVNSTLKQRQNVGEAEIKGVEIDGTWYITRPWSVRVAAAYMHATDTENDIPLEAVPEMTMRVSTRYGRDGSPWYVEGVARGAIERDRVNPMTERPRGGYVMFDAYASADLGKTIGPSWHKWRLTAGIENMFNRTVSSQVAAENLSYTTGLIGNPLLEPGRSFVAKLVHDF